MKALLALAALALSACASGPAPAPTQGIYVGYLKQGFETSDFYPADGAPRGPWWTTVEESEQAKLMALARGEGRGRAVVVWISAEGEDRGPVDFGIRPKFETSIHITRINMVRAVSDEEYQGAMERGRQER